MAEEMKKGFSLECKKLMAEELSKQFEAFPNFIITNFFGLSNNNLNELRKDLSKVSSRYFVIKNRIGLRVMEALKLKDVKDTIEGGVGIGFFGEDAVSTSRKIVDFSKKYGFFKIKGGYIDGKKIDVEKVKQLASLPSREVLLTMIVTTMNAPISRFVNVLGRMIPKFVYAINAIKEKKEREEKMRSLVT